MCILFEYRIRHQRMLDYLSVQSMAVNSFQKNGHEWVGGAELYPVFVILDIYLTLQSLL